MTGRDRRDVVADARTCVGDLVASAAADGRAACSVSGAGLDLTATLAESGLLDGSVVVVLGQEASGAPSLRFPDRSGPPSPHRPPRARRLAALVMLVVGLAMVLAPSCVVLLELLWRRAGSLSVLRPAPLLIAVVVLTVRVAPELAVRLTLRGVCDAPPGASLAPALVRQATRRRRVARAVVLPPLALAVAVTAADPVARSLPTVALMVCAATVFALMHRSATRGTDGEAAGVATAFAGVGVVVPWVGHLAAGAGVAVIAGTTLVAVMVLVGDDDSAASHRSLWRARVLDATETLAAVAVLPLALWASGAVALLAHAAA